jgi:ribosome biogenesis protein Nip4
MRTMRTVSGYTRTGMSIIIQADSVYGDVEVSSGFGGGAVRGAVLYIEGTSLIYRVYYLPVAMLHLATSVARSNLISLGTCFGKFSKTGKFKLGITSLDWLAKYAKYKVCRAGRP